jgi:exoribonuclease-2
MLPPSLSREAGSLAPGVPRRALSLLVGFDGDLGITGWEIVPTVVESKTRLSYEEAELILESPDHALAPPLRLLRAVADRLKEQRLEKGALELDRPEVKVSVDGEGRITVGVVERPTEARGLVAEFMILANRLMAEYCRDHAIPAVYRTQGAVSLEGLPETSVEAVRQFQIFRRVRPAGVTTTPGPHALLGLDVYLQATSPIRRYTDLVAQRQVAHHLAHGEPLYDLEQVEEVLHLVGQGQRDRGRAETVRKQYWLLKSMSACLGEVFPAVVLDLRDRHALLELERLQLRTTVYVGPGVGVGQTVALRLRDVDLWSGQTSFTYEPEGADPSP